MTTVATLVARSLRLIQVIDAVQPVKPQDMTAAIDAMNAMLRRWEANGIALGWQPVSSPSDTLPIPDEAEEAVAYGLAVRLGPEYGTEVSLIVGMGAEQFLNELRRDQAVATPIRPILSVPVPDVWGWRVGGLNNSWWNG